MRPLSEDLRKRIIDQREAGNRATEISQRFGVSRRTVYRLYERYLQSGSLAALRVGKPEGSKLDTYKDEVTTWIEGDYGSTLEQLQQRCLDELELEVSVSTLHRVIEQWGFSYKKTLFAKEQKRPEVQRMRELWHERQKGWDARRLVFIDGTKYLQPQ